MFSVYSPVYPIAAIWEWCVETWIGRLCLFGTFLLCGIVYAPLGYDLIILYCALYFFYSLWMASIKTESKGLNVFFLYPLHPWLKGRVQKLTGITASDELCEMHARSSKMKKLSSRKIVLSIRNDCKTIEENFMPDHTVTIAASMYADSFADIGFRVTENFRELKRIQGLSAFGQRILSRNKKWETRVWERPTRAISNVIR